MRKILLILQLLIFAAAYAGEGAAAPKSAAEVRQIAQAGASLVIDLNQFGFSEAELVQIAQSLAGNATLTLKVGRLDRHSTAQLLQIVKVRPGRITIWLGD